MSAKKYEYVEEEPQNIRGPKRIVFTSATGEFKMFDTLKSSKRLQKEGGLTEKAAATIVDVLAESSKHDLANLATKQDVHAVKQDLQLVEQKLKAEIALVNTRVSHIEEKMATKEDLEKMQSYLLKTMAAMLAGTAGIIIAAVSLFIK